MAKADNNYVALKIGYDDFIMTLDQAQAIQRAMVGSVKAINCYSAKQSFLYGCRQVDCEV